MAKEKKCLNCKFFRLLDIEVGLCRVDKSVTEYPEKSPEDCCSNWADSGQQYFIRLGWIKAKLAEQKQ